MAGSAGVLLEHSSVTRGAVWGLTVDLTVCGRMLAGRTPCGSQACMVDAGYMHLQLLQAEGCWGPSMPAAKNQAARGHGALLHPPADQQQ